MRWMSPESRAFPRQEPGRDRDVLEAGDGQHKDKGRTQKNFSVGVPARLQTGSRDGASVLALPAREC